jgi:hypothetical protein
VNIIEEIPTLMPCIGKLWAINVVLVIVKDSLKFDHLYESVKFTLLNE